MIRSLFAAALMAANFSILPNSQAQANGGAVVVELFTSQGCSSCPPADALLHKLGEFDDLIPLALHVDYWDYIGWKDSFADPMHTVRQKAYAETGGRRMIYTPQMIIMGQDDVVGADAMKVSELLKKHRKSPKPVSIATVRKGASVLVQVTANEQIDGNFVVQLVRYSPREEISISRGELAGRTMDYSHIVRDWQHVGTWDGANTASFNVTLPGDEKSVVIVQRDEAGPIIAAIRLD